MYYVMSGIMDFYVFNFMPILVSWHGEPGDLRFYAYDMFHSCGMKYVGWVCDQLG